MSVITKERELVRHLNQAGIRSRRWRSSGDQTPVADVGWKGRLRIHTGGQPTEVFIDPTYRQAVLAPLRGAFKGQHFLIGMDESSNFVSLLPSGVSSVDEAHEILRPNDVPEGSLRQGEWFLLPTLKCDCGKLLDELNDPEMGQYEHQPQMDRALGGTTHHATERIEHRGRTYVRGAVYDERPGRHKQVILEDWHEARRNTERIIPKEPRRQRARMFD